MPMLIPPMINITMPSVIGTRAGGQLGLLGGQGEGPFPPPGSENTVIDPESGIITTYVNAIQEPLVPVSEDLVRLTYMHCRLIYEPVLKNRSRVTCFLKIDPGGNIPNFFVNFMMKKWPYKTLYEARILAKNEKYIKAAAAAGKK